MTIGTPTGSSNSNFSVMEVDDAKMKLVYFSNEFPHDDLASLLRELQTHSRDRRYPILAQFLDEATLAIRDEVRQLPTTLRVQVPPFENVIGLADFVDLRKGPLSGAVDGVLLSIGEIGTFIG
jgi:monodictyphenone polyketide synthase